MPEDESLANTAWGGFSGRKGDIYQLESKPYAVHPVVSNVLLPYDLDHQSLGYREAGWSNEVTTPKRQQQLPFYRDL
jgi:hypothetical protein